MPKGKADHWSKTQHNFSFWFRTCSLACLILLAAEQQAEWSKSTLGPRVEKQEIYEIFISKPVRQVFEWSISPKIQIDYALIE